MASLKNDGSETVLEPYALLCKSFRGDLNRLKILVSSVEEHMVGEIPFIIMCPSDDVQLFSEELPSWVEIQNESEIAQFSTNSRLGVWREQQLIKLMFGVQGRFEKYYILDSDSYFLRPFTAESIFGSDNRVPFVVSPNYYRYRSNDGFTHSLSLATTAKPTGFPVERVAYRSADFFKIDRELIDSSEHARRKPSEVGGLIGKAFGRTDAIPLFFMPTPIVWSSAIVIDFWNYLRSEDLTFSDLLKYSPWEALWYANWAMQRHRSSLVTREPDFLHFESDEEVHAARRLGVTERTLSINFLGVTLAARHQNDLRFDKTAP